MKPLVFISYSSRDAEVVQRLQRLLLSRTNNTIRFFISGDRLSVAPGKLWIEQILEALSTSSLAFILLTPNSMESQWIPFEAGLCYNRGIQTVPVGMLGVDATALNPPFGLLQGFNLDSAAGLERMVIEINSVFGHSHSTTFSEQEYDSLWSPSVAPLPDGEYGFRVFTTLADGERAHEVLTISIAQSRMFVRSSSHQRWESLGIFDRNRYVGRFKLSRGSSTDDLGIHDLAWNGREFVGSGRLDSGRWAADNLVWRPITAIPRPAGS